MFTQLGQRHKKQEELRESMAKGNAMKDFYKVFTDTGGHWVSVLFPPSSLVHIEVQTVTLSPRLT